MTPYERTAHLHLAVDIVSDKWRLAVLHLLAHATLRTSQLQKALEEVAPKVLTQTLRGLERDGLVERQAFAGAPLRVEYRLTHIAQRLLVALNDLCQWSQAYGPETVIAQMRYDTRASRTWQNAPPRGAPGRAAGTGPSTHSIVNTTRNRALPDIIRS